MSWCKEQKVNLGLWIIVFRTLCLDEGDLKTLRVEGTERFVGEKDLVQDLTDSQGSYLRMEAICWLRSY